MQHVVPPSGIAIWQGRCPPEDNSTERILPNGANIGVISAAICITPHLDRKGDRLKAGQHTAHLRRRALIVIRCCRATSDPGAGFRTWFSQESGDFTRRCGGVVREFGKA